MRKKIAKFNLYLFSCHHHTKVFESMFKDLDFKVEKTYSLKFIRKAERQKSRVSKSAEYVYAINCNDYNKKCYGQSRKTIETRYGKHFTHTTYGRSEKLSVPYHVLNSGHSRK